MSRLSALIMATMMTIPTMAAEKATVKVTPVSQDADAANGGMIYALPKTVAQIRLTAQVVVSSVGPYYQYSTRFLNLTDVVTENSMKWKLIGAEITTTGQVDYSRRFKISTTDDGQMPQIALVTNFMKIRISSFPKKILGKGKNRTIILIHNAAASDRKNIEHTSSLMKAQC